MVQGKEIIFILFIILVYVFLFVYVVKGKDKRIKRLEDFILFSKNERAGIISGEKEKESKVGRIIEKVKKDREVKKDVTFESVMSEGIINKKQKKLLGMEKRLE